MHNYLEILAKNINLYLEKNYKRPAWLADESGLKASNISRILGRSGNPTLDTIVAIAEAMKMEPGDLLEKYSTPEHFELIMLQRELSLYRHELKNVKTAHERSLDSKRPMSRVHPAELARQISELTKIIERNENKISILKDHLKKPAAAAHEPNSTREGSILNIIAALPALNQDQLSVIVGVIEDLGVLEAASTPKASRKV